MSSELTHVLYLSYDGLTDPLGQSQILPYVKGLTSAGYRITLVSFEKPGRASRLHASIQKECDEACIVWEPLIYTKRPPVLSTLHDLRKLRLTVKRIHSADPISFIHCRSYLTALIALRFKRKARVPFIFDMRGFWADERVDGSIWNLRNPIFRLIYSYFKVKEREMLENADAVVSLTHAGKAEMVRWFYENPQYGGETYNFNHDAAEAFSQKTSVIPCATDLVHFDPGKVGHAKRQWMAAVHGIDLNHNYLGYVGSLGTWYMCDEMVECYAALRKTDPELRFLIVTQEDASGLRIKAEQEGIPQSHMVCVSASRKEVPVLMSMMVASVFFIKPAFSKKASSPTKQGELMGMGVPVICNEGVGDSGDLVRKYNAGIVVADFAVNSLRETAAAWSSLVKLRKDKIREGAVDYFSLEEGVNAYEAIYLRLKGEAIVSEAN